MASVKCELRRVTKTVVTDEPTIVLEMDEDEAQALADILCWVGGKQGTRRDHISAILKALSNEGLESDVECGDIKMMDHAYSPPQECEATSNELIELDFVTR
jgi:hypothetical protein